MASTTDDLVEDVRELACLPDAGPTTDAVILAHADAEQVGLLSALMKTAQMNHWISVDDTPGDGSTTRFKIPRRALDRAYHNVMTVDSGGVELECHEVVAGDPRRSERLYRVEMDTLVFTAPPSSGRTIRVRNRRRSSKLVLTSACAAITQATDTTHIAIANVPSTFTGTKYRYYDIVCGDAPHDLLYVDRQVRDISAPGSIALSGSTPIVVADFVDTTAILNARQDYLCLRDETCYPPLPEGGFPALVAGTARRILESLGDPRVPVIEATYKERLKTALSLISPRDDMGGKPIINRSSSLRGGGGGFRRTRW